MALSISKEYIYRVIFLLFALVFLQSCATLGKMKVTVVDMEGKPLTGARIIMRSGVSMPNFDFSGKSGPGSSRTTMNKEALTDENGEVSLFGLVSKKGVYVEAYKAGYYKTKNYMTSGEHMVIPLREIRSPIPVFTRKIRKRLPGKKGIYGYDVLKNAFSHPYGQGNYSDFMIYVDTKMVGHGQTKKEKLIGKVVVPRKGYGFRKVLISSFSNYPSTEFSYPYHAPTSGYKDTIRLASKDLSKDKNGRRTAYHWYKKTVPDVHSHVLYYFKVRDEKDKVKYLVDRNPQKGPLYGRINSYNSFRFYLSHRDGEPYFAFKYDMNSKGTTNFEKRRGYVGSE